jgi:hypothetical protein
MSIVFTDGFETGDYSLWTTTGGGVDTVSTVGMDMTGNWAAKMTGSTAYFIEKTFPTSWTEMSFSYKHRWTSLDSGPGNYDIFGIGALGGGFCMSLRPDNNYKLALFLNGVQVVVGTHQILVNTTYNIDIYYNIAAVGGRVIFKINNVTDIDFTGNTIPTVGTRFNRVRFSATNTGHGFGFLVDDFTMNDMISTSSLFFALG